MKTRLFSLSLIMLAAVQVFAGRIYLIGDAMSSGWSLDDAPLMEQTGDNVYQWVGNLNDGTLKFLTHKDFVPSYGPTTNNTALTVGTSDLQLRSSYDDPDNAFAVTAGRYALTIDLSGDTPQLTVANGAELPDKGLSSYYPEAIYAIGSATTAGWTASNAVEMHESACNSGIYNGTLTLSSGELKFLNQKDWGAGYGASVSNDPINGAGVYTLVALDKADLKFAVTFNEATEFDVTANIVAGSLSLTATGVEPEVVYPAKLYIIGPAVGGWSWDDNGLEMTTLEEGVYTWTGKLLAGEMKFFEQPDFGAVAYGATEAGKVMSADGEYDIVKLTDNDNKFIAPANNVTLTVNLKTMKLTSAKDVTSLSDIVLLDGMTDVYDITGSFVTRIENSYVGSCGLKAGIYIFRSAQITQKVVIR